MRIRGLVRVAHQVREQLTTGIPAQEVQQFQQWVRGTLDTVDRLCIRAGSTPAQLPTPSRKAYDFLSQVDLENLSIAAVATGAPHRVRLPRMQQHQQLLLEKMAALARLPRLEREQSQAVQHQLQQTLAQIQAFCLQEQIHPTQLTERSRKIYGWMQFLQVEANFQAHLSATRRLQQGLIAGAEVVGINPPSGVTIELINMAGLYRYRPSPTQGRLQIHEGFIAAGDRVLEALVDLVLTGKSAANQALIRSFALSPAFSTVLRELDRLPGATPNLAQGKAYNLESIFMVVNREYFKGSMLPPQLCWNRCFTVRKFAHYEPARDRIVVSLTLDDPQIPAYVVEFVMYHELLHKHHGDRWSQGRLLSHSPAFRRDERQFKQYDQAQAWLTRLAQS